MSSSGLDVFDSTLQKTHRWLNDIMDELEIDNRRHAYLALRGVLHALRDHLTLEEVAQLSAQLPMLVRGIYYEGWDPTNKPVKERDRGAFLSRVYYEVTPGFSDADIGMVQVVRAVFAVLNRQVSPGEIEDVRALLPKAVRELWPTTAAS